MVIGLFSLATPVGIFAGYGLSSESPGASKSGAALSALASGTFLYVGECRARTPPLPPP